MSDSVFIALGAVAIGVLIFGFVLYNAMKKKQARPSK